MLEDIAKAKLKVFVDLSSSLRHAANAHEYAAVRFSSNSAAEAWLGSSIREEWLSSIVFALASDEQLEIKSGIDFWFTPRPRKPSTH
ncbi:hypothetical protein [Modicisalibacter luteus]|uniref:Uncharacterized protein n=1 Tax=Modicisalibacter luteus TaxID=453962 RepID=A0ABV7LZ33_9GAMM|nr:hypothetical protein [Halomonas lutea]